CSGAVAVHDEVASAAEGTLQKYGDAAWEPPRKRPGRVKATTFEFRVLTGRSPLGPTPTAAPISDGRHGGEAATLVYDFVSYSDLPTDKQVFAVNNMDTVLDGVLSGYQWRQRLGVTLFYLP